MENEKLVKEQSLKPMRPAKLLGLQALRLIACLGIFFSHTGIGVFSGTGAFGVSIFFILSGFLLTYNYLPKENEIKNPIKFSLKKISKLYLLHILMLLIALLYTCVTGEQQENLIANIILKVFLLQIWVPEGSFYYGPNGVCWFLSVMMFLYFLFPFILKLIKKLKGKNALVITALIIFAIRILIASIIPLFCSDDKMALFSQHYITYYCPLYRLGDFLVGCLLGRYFLQYKKDVSKIFDTIVEIVAVVLGVVALFIRYKVNMPDSFHSTIIFTPSAILLVWVFAKNSGFLTKIFTNKATIFLGELTDVVFLIHVQALDWCQLIIFYFVKNLNTYVLVAIILIITFVSAWLWHVFEKFINVEKFKKTI